MVELPGLKSITSGALCAEVSISAAFGLPMAAPLRPRRGLPATELPSSKPKKLRKDRNQPVFPR